MIFLVPCSVLGSKERTESVSPHSSASPTLAWVFKTSRGFKLQHLTEILSHNDFPYHFNFHQIEPCHFLVVFHYQKQRVDELPSRRDLEALTYGSDGRLSKAYFLKITKHVKTVLENHTDVQWFSQQILRFRFKRSIFNDPAFNKQWHLVSFIFFNFVKLMQYPQFMFIGNKHVFFYSNRYYVYHSIFRMYACVTVTYSAVNVSRNI